MDDIVFKEFFPPIPSYQRMYMLEAMTYKVMLDATPLANIESHDIIVEAWTNQYDQDNCEGKWHPVTLKFLGDEGNLKIYGASIIITSTQDFEFTFRARLKHKNEHRWSHDYGINGKTHVEPPEEDNISTQKAEYDHITRNVYCGNFIAACNAKQCGFTHVLNVGANLDVIYPSGEEVIYRKVGMKDSAHNPIPDYLLHEAVSWLTEHDQSGNRVLVNCRFGIGRAGSTMVAYIFALNTSFTFQQAINYVCERRFVYPHSGLKESLYRLFPRT